MTLTLRIDNLSHLPDGGPIEFRTEGRGFEIGRDPAMDWTLPDPNRFVSSCHLEVRYQDDAYWLYDVSTNGTFVNGGTSRMKSPHQLRHDDRLQIGHYVVRVDLQAAQATAPSHAGFGNAGFDSAGFGAPPPPPAPSGGDIWSLGGGGSSGGASSGAFGQDFSPRGTPRQSDFGDEHIPMGGFGGPPVAPARPAPVPAESDGGSPFGAAPGASPAPTAPERTPHPGAGMGAGTGTGPGENASPFAAAPPPPVAAPTAPDPSTPPAPPAQALPPSGGFGAPPPSSRAAPTPPPTPAPPASGTGDAALLRAICEGAGLAPDALDGVDPAVAGQEIGRALRVVAGELTALLKARDANKLLIRSGSRTMLNHEANNPLKFIPTPEEALEVMFGRGRPGYQRGTEALTAAFRDVNRHQYALYAAIQPALAELLEDISPEAIEEKTGGGRFGRSSKSWELFVERWDAMTHQHDNGMLDVFLNYFAEAYDKASNSR